MTRRPVHRAGLDRPAPLASTRVDTSTIPARRRTAPHKVGHGGHPPRSVATLPSGPVSPSSTDSAAPGGSRGDLNQTPGGSGAAAREPAPASDVATSGGPPEPTPGVEAGLHAYESLVALCRHDVDAFCEFVLRDEETGAPIEQAEMHVAMQSAYDEHRFVIVLAHPESGKTQQFAVGRTLHELGRNPELRTVFLNNGQDGAKKNLSAAKKYIERSEELRAVFPRLRPGALWREDAVTVERSGYSRDPSIYCLGFHGNILGARIDRAVVDDLLDYENTRTEQARRDASSWFKRTFLTRLTRDARLAFLTNAWHEEDLAHELEDDGWFTLRYPVLDARGRSTWPERWSLGRIAEWRRRLGELEFARMFLCEPRDPGAMSFRPEWLRAALRRGVGYGFVDQVGDPPHGALIVTGCDLGASRRMTGGATTMLTLCVHRSGLRQLVAARSGRWSGGDVMRNLVDVGERYGGVIVVEDNGIQRHIVELANEEGVAVPVPVLPFYTGRNKYDVTLGVDAMAAEFEAGRWMLPSGRSGRDVPDEVRRLLGEARAYSPGSHPGDRLMGLWFARTWALRRLRALQAGPKGGVRVRVFGGRPELPAPAQPPARRDRPSDAELRRRVRALTTRAEPR